MCVRGRAGTEAGGHVRGNQQLDQVLAETLSLVDVPMIASGGIGSAARAAQLLNAGAAAVRCGTRFVTAAEADAHPAYVQALIAAGAKDAVLTEAFGTGWPDAPHRVLRSSLDAAKAFTGDVVATVGTRSLPPSIRRCERILADARSEVVGVRMLGQLAVLVAMRGDRDRAYELLDRLHEIAPRRDGGDAGACATINQLL